MKSLLFMTIAALVVVFVAVGLAVANGGPHGGYTSTTDACAGCHRTHTAVGPFLLVQSSTYNLCQSCHGTSGTGANTNVEDGFFLHTRNASVSDGVANTADNAALLGGGFVNYKGVATTSSHSATGSIGVAWGNGGERGTMAALAAGATLSCASCHDPHGSANYRIMETRVNSVTVSIPLVDEGAAKDYDDEHWGAGMSQICKACHSSYHVTRAGSGHDKGDNGTGNADYGGSITTFAHRVDMPYNYGGNADPEATGLVSGTVTLRLPLADDAGDDKVVCTTCHLAHGTSAQMTGFASSSAGPSGGSALLRLDNRGTCQVCHQK